MKLTTTTIISVDGVMQSPGGPDQERSGSFERGGWSTPHVSPEGMAFVQENFERADAFLFGRRTYEHFAESWGARDPDSHPVAHALHSKPKYVVSNSLKAAEWHPSTIISGDVAAAVRDLKAQPGSELQVHGSGVLIRWLLENDFVDELNLIRVPAIVGQGTRLFPESGRDIGLSLIDSRETSSGVMIETYRTGPPQYANMGG